MRLLQRLSASLLFAEYPSAAEAPPDLHEFWRKVEVSIRTLRDLEINTKDSRRDHSWSPMNFKRERAVTNHSRGANAPTTDAEACEIRTRVLSELQGMLEVCGSRPIPLHTTLNRSQYYLLVLRQPLVSEIFKSSYARIYLTKEKTSEESLAEENVSSPNTETVEPIPDQPSGPAFPTIQPMKASLYFDGVEGFGEWPINLSTRALKDLRDVKRSDGSMFQIVMKKIKYL